VTLHDRHSTAPLTRVLHDLRLRTDTMRMHQRSCLRVLCKAMCNPRYGNQFLQPGSCACTLLDQLPTSNLAGASVRWYQVLAAAVRLILATKSHQPLEQDAGSQVRSLPPAHVNLTLYRQCMLYIGERLNFHPPRITYNINAVTFDAGLNGGVPVACNLPAAGRLPVLGC
jgi:hypothetical protein